MDIRAQLNQEWKAIVNRFIKHYETRFTAEKCIKRARGNGGRNVPWPSLIYLEHSMEWRLVCAKFVNHVLNRLTIELRVNFLDLKVAENGKYGIGYLSLTNNMCYRLSHTKGARIEEDFFDEIWRI